VSAPFDRTIRALQTDGLNPTVLGLITITAVVAIWSCWLLLGRVAVYETSAAARLEVERVHPVAVAVGGRIVASHLALGRQVRRGDVLLEIAADRERLETTEERTRFAALRTQIAAIETEIAGEEQALALAEQASRAALAEARQKLQTALAAARQAEDYDGRLRQLGKRGLVSDLDVVRARTDAERGRAEVASARLGIERLRAQQIAADREQRSHVGALVRERVTLEGQLSTADAVVTRREREADERLITAPVDGRLGEIAPLEVGAVIREGERVASIVPDGPVRAVAEFLPAALGRLRAGQPARLRLDAFPWTQYGYIPATVHSVASETREGRIRVEFDLHRSPSLPMVLQHGLPGAVEVEVERVAPVALLVRTLGQAVAIADVRPDDPPAPERVSQ
jgi:multidrug resistance efflux pump